MADNSGVGTIDPMSCQRDKIFFNCTLSLTKIDIRRDPLQLLKAAKSFGSARPAGKAHRASLDPLAGCKAQLRGKRGR
jgi:hypothetical protein